MAKEFNPVETLIKGEVKNSKSSMSSEVEMMKQDLDTAMAAINKLESSWNPITLTDAK